MALENKPIEVTLIIILLQEAMLAAILILIPPCSGTTVHRRRKINAMNFGFFAALGMGFIMIEISFIQRFYPYLGQPVYTLAVIIAGLLLFTGWGHGYQINLTKADLQRSIFRFIDCFNGYYYSGNSSLSNERLSP
jgi:hypothetical protein